MRSRLEFWATNARRRPSGDIASLFGGRAEARLPFAGESTVGRTAGRSSTGAAPFRQYRPATRAAPPSRLASVYAMFAPPLLPRAVGSARAVLPAAWVTHCKS